MWSQNLHPILGNELYSSNYIIGCNYKGYDSWNGFNRDHYVGNDEMS